MWGSSIGCNGPGERRGEETVIRQCWISWNDGYDSFIDDHRAVSI